MENIDIASLNFDTSKLANSALEARKEIDQLTNQISSSRKEARDSQKTIDILSQANKKLAESGKEGSKAYKENEAEIKKLSKTIDYNTRLIVENESKKRNLNKEQREINKILDLQTKAQTDNTLAVEQSNAILEQGFSTQQEAFDLGKAMMSLRKQLNPEIEEEAELMAKLATRIDEANDFQDLYNTKNEERVKGIGTYREQVEEAIKSTLGFGSATGGAAKGMGGFNSGITGAIGGFSGLTKGAQAFTAVPLIAVVTLLIKGFQFLYEKFTSTQAGMDKITAVTRPLMAIFDSLTGVIQNLTTSLFDMATNPKKALNDLVDFVKNNVLNRFKAFGVILEAIENRDFKGLRNGIAQAVTGVENLEDKIRDGAKRTGEFLKTAYEAGVRIDQLQKDIEQREADMLILQSDITTEMREQEVIAKDTNRSSEERAEAIKRQTELSKQLTVAEQGILDLKIEQETVQQSFNDSSRKDLAKLNALVAERKNTENNLTDTIRRNLGVEKQLRNEAARAAADAQKERMRQILEVKSAELELFVLRNEKNKDSLADELDFYEQVQKQKTDILKQQLKANVISEVAYNTEIEKLGIETAKQEAESVLFYATQKLNTEIRTLQELQSERKRFNNESFESEKELIERINAEQLTNAKERLDAGLINRHEYNDLVLEIETQQQDKLKEIQDAYDLQRSEDKKLAKLLENEQILLGIEDQFEREQELLDQQFQTEQDNLQEQRDQGKISEENYLKAINNLRQKYADSQMAIDEAVAENKVSLMSDAFSNISTILGKESTAGKFFASAAALVDTYAAANKALAAYPPPFSYIAAGAAVVTGLGNVAKINKVKTQKYTGGYTGDGGMFTRTGYVHAGETVFNQDDVRQLGGADAVDRLRPTSSTYGQMPTGIAQGNDSMNWVAIAKILGDEVRIGSQQGTGNGLVEASDNASVRQNARF